MQTNRNMKAKNIYIYILILSSIAINTLTAQVPGYMGKRTLFTAHIAPAMTLPVNIESGTGITYEFKITPRVGFNLEHVYNRKNSIGFSYAYHAFNANVPVYKTYYYGSGNTVYGHKDGISPVKYNQHRLGIVFNKATSGDLSAPLGNYIGFDLGIDIFGINDVKGKLERPDSSFAKGKYLSRVKPHAYFLYGHRRALGNSLLMSVQFEFNLYYILNAYISSATSSNPPEGVSWAGEEQWSINYNLAQKYYLLSNFATVSLQFSILPF